MMSDKAPDAYRTISEVAEDLDLPQHVLRFWETRFSQIKPLKRGGGRRYYRPDDLALLRGIRELLYKQGYTIKGVQRILRDRGVKSVQGVGRGESLITAAPTNGSHAPAAEMPSNELESMEALHAVQEETAAPVQQGRTLQENQRLRLRAALFELTECRRLLDVAMSPGEPDPSKS